MSEPGVGTPTQLDAVAQAIAEDADDCYWNLLAPDEREPYYKRAQAAIDALQLTEEWGVVSPREEEPNQRFDFRVSADKQAAARTGHGIPSTVVSRLLGPWVVVGQQNEGEQ
jgi:hypothetical protein